MVTNEGPELVLQQLEASHRRKRSINPELLEHFARQDRRLFDLVLRHRAGEPVSEAIVAELLPAVRAKAARLSPVRLYGRDDLRQELTVELFHVARTIPLSRPDFLTRRLMLGAAKRLTRRLEREWYQQMEEWYRQLGQAPGAEGDGEQAENDL